MNDRYHHFFDTSHDGMYITTREGHFVDVNQAFCSLLNYQRQDLLGHPVEETLALPMERRRFRHEIEANNSVSHFKIKLLTRGGQEITCTIDAVLLRDQAGEIDGYMGIVRQVKNPLATPIHIDLDVQKFALAIRGSSDGLWEWDIKKKEVHYSARWKAILGYSSFELTKNISEWFDRVHLDDIQAVKQALNQYLRGETHTFSTYFRMTTKTGETLWMMARAVGEFDENGKCARVAGSFSNVTSHIKMIENLKAQEERLAQMTASLVSDKALLSRYFSGDMLSQIFQGGNANIQESTGPAAILQIHINKTVGAWTKIGVKEYATFINELITDLMDLVYGHQGSVNKILGDTLLVSFGSPLAQDGDLQRALSCAEEIIGYMSTYNDVRPAYVLQTVTISMGLAYGEVFSATLGSVHRLEYTLVGQPVDRAETLQKAAEKFSTSLLVDQTVKTALDPETAGFKEFTATPGQPPIKGIFTI